MAGSVVLYVLVRRSKQINRWKKIVSRSKGKLVKMIKDAGSKFDNYSISPKVKHVIALELQISRRRFFNELSN